MSSDGFETARRIAADLLRAAALLGVGGPAARRQPHALQHARLVAALGPVVKPTPRPRRRVLLGALGALGALACRRGGVVAVDAVDAGAPARRIVSLVPSTTETLFALGLGDRVVGVSTYCDHPPEAARRPRVGAMLNPSLEAIVSLRPDALVGVEGPVNLAVLERLRARGVRTVFPRTESVPEVLDALDVLARLAGEPARAVPLRARIEAQLARVEAVVRGRPRPRVLMVFSVRPLVVAGPGSWTDAVLTRAGGVNAATGASRYPTVSVEQVLAWGPEVILDLSTMSTEAPPDGSLVAALTAHGAVPAVTAGRVHALTDPRYVRPGPRVGEAAEGIARVLHPDARW